MSDALDPLISIPAAAKAIGLDRTTLGKQVRQGIIRSHDGKVRLSEVLADRAANIDLGRSKRHRGAIDEPEAAAARPQVPTRTARLAVSREPGEPEPVDEDEDADDEAPVIVDGAAMSYADARALKETYLARLKRLEFETKRGELGRIADFKARGEDIIVIVKDVLLAVPGECADRLSSDQVEYVREKLYDAMEHLSALGTQAEDLLASARRGDIDDPEGD